MKKQKTLIVSAFVTINVIKICIFYFFNDLHVFQITWTEDLLIVFIAAIAVSALPFNLSLLMYAVFDFVISAVVMIDTGYLRIFSRMLPLDALKQARLLPHINIAIMEVFHWYEWLVLLTPVVYAIMAFAFKKKKGSTTDMNSATRVLTLYFKILTACVLFAVSLRYLNFVQKKVYNDPWNQPSDMLLLKKLGLLGFHYNEAVLRIKKGKKTRFSDEEIKKAQEILKKHRLKGSDTYKELAGSYSGYNIIVVLMESLQAFMIGQILHGQELTPTLNKLLNESLYFSDFYSTVSMGNTSDAEFSVNNSLLPLPDDSVYVSYYARDYIALPSILAEKGYGTYVFHAYRPNFWNRSKAYLYQGIQKFFYDKYFRIDEKIGLGLSDGSFFRQVVSKMEKLPQPFYALVITLSNHYPYKLPPDLIALDLSFIGYEQFRNYLESVHYMDTALGIFIEKLRKTGILDRSILVVFGDHFAPMNNAYLTMNTIKKFFKTSGTPFERSRVPLFIRLPGGHPSAVIDKSGSHRDIEPTLLYLTGYYRENIPMLGENLLAEGEGFVPFLYYFGNGSWLNRSKYFYLKRGERLRRGRCFSRTEKRKLPYEECKAGIERARREIRASEVLIKGNLIKKIFKYKKFN